jgi:mannose/fructose/N-acetylgalactosamine-specific phosphotransferase system component IIC
MGERPPAAKDRRDFKRTIAMDFGALNWMTITGIGVALLAIVIAVAALRNRSSKELVEKSEAATRDLYKEEDIAHQNDSNGRY